MTKNIRKLKNDISGASAAEYALIIALVGVAIIAGGASLGGAVNARLSNAASSVTG